VEWDEEAHEAAAAEAKMAPGEESRGTVAH